MSHLCILLMIKIRFKEDLERIPGTSGGNFKIRGMSGLRIIRVKLEIK